jgi:hypothetical protein
MFGIISSFLVLGILPHPDEFQEICLRTMGEHDVADDFISKGVCFDPNEKIPYFLIYLSTFIFE